jgi:glucose-6-phosphate 1-dehydrogenase
VAAVTVSKARKPVDTSIPVPEDHVIVLFGASGDLARRKLLPGLFHLSEAGLMPEHFRIVGCSRNEMSDEDFRDFARAAVDEFGRMDPTDEAWARFGPMLSYVGTAEGLGALKGAVDEARSELGDDTRQLHYLSVPPGAAPGIVEEIGMIGLARRARVILEKPFGTDLRSARKLNAVVHRVFREPQVFRIDHFLGKEAVQNILALRFANGLFEPVWNREHVDHVQIDVPETLSVGTRGGFYEQTGAFRDMIVTHLFQVLAFVAMEPPTSLKPETLVIEKLKVFESMETIDPADVVRGQYEGYRDTDGVASDSETETFVALRVQIDNWRWAGIPFYLRTGKCLAKDAHSITIAFREPPRKMFELDRGALDPNLLTFDIGEPGSITATFLAKEPGARMRLGNAMMVFEYEDTFCTEMQLEAYERLLHDAMMGDRTLFTTADGIERLWEISAPLLEHPPPVLPYKPGSWGPEAAAELTAPSHWHATDHDSARG